MPKCDTCGNEYDKSFELRVNGDPYIFDCFECAIQKLAPSCSRCSCRIIGHGIEARGKYYCGAHCAGSAGIEGARDRL